MLVVFAVISYYRLSLNVVAIEMPSLRQRREDIPLLAAFIFAARFAERNRKSGEGLRRRRDGSADPLRLAVRSSAAELEKRYRAGGGVADGENTFLNANSPRYCRDAPIKTEYSGEIQPLVTSKKR